MTARVLQLRDGFDRGFAVAPPPPVPEHSDFLCIRVGGEPSAIALGDVATLHADLRIIPLPSRAPELLGVAAIRAAVVPIYDLRVAFGVSGSGVPRWTVVVAGSLAGFGFDSYDGHARIADRSIAAAPPGGHVRGQFTFDGQPRSIVDLRSVLAAIESR
jgi:chemotaxis signal transduction protein